MPYHSYLFFDALPSLAAVPEAKLEKWRAAFLKKVQGAKGVKTEAYATLAMKAGTRFMLYMNAADPETVQKLVRDLLHTPLGKHLTIAHSFLGLTRSSQYNPTKAPAASAPETPHRYLTVYPFVKTIEWHLLPYEERRNMMKAHVEVGRKFSSSISQLLLYSFGLDDQEFIVSYQMDSLEEFQTLVMELRNTEARRYTLRDTPIFTCIHLPLKEALRMV